MGYKDDIRIDIHALDAEWIKQASLYQYYAKKEAVALYERDQLTNSLALVQAQLDGDIRLDPKKHGFDSKPTEAAILNSIKQNPFYIKANNLLMKASCKAKIIGSAVRAFDHKKKALEKLTDLYLSGYWAAPKIKSEAQEVFGKQTRMDLEESLQREDRLIAASLKKKGADKKKNKTKAEMEIEAEAAAINKRKKDGKKAEADATKIKSESKPTAITKAKGKGKIKPEPKPTGRTKRDLQKQSRAASSPKTV